MKLFFLLLFCSFLTVAQDYPKNISILNTVPVIEGKLHAAVSEVSNIQYREFLDFIKRTEGVEMFNELYPDTTVWTNNGRFYNSPYVDYYLRHPAYNNYPVVGVSFEQANHYCEWLTNLLSDKFSKDEKQPIESVKVRLPSYHEWKLAAKAGDKQAVFAWGGDQIRAKEGKFQGAVKGNFIRGKGDFMGVAGLLNDGADVTAPVKSYWPNDFGIYNMSGNVSELLLDERYTGGSWNDRVDALYIDASPKEFIDEKSRENVGFRYFVEITSFKNIKPKTISLSTKYIEELIASIVLYNDGETILASKYEVTNELYNLFLEENNVNKNQRANSSWNGVTNYGTQLANNYASNSIYSNYPVVNISYESAEEFCVWLTEKYNSFEKRKYKNYKFQLPSEKEWEMLAQGRVVGSVYPWGGPYIRNSKGCYLANFHTVEEKWIVDRDSNFLINNIDVFELEASRKLDGGDFTVAVDSYHPNGFGLYNMPGNVAEMVKGEILKGGSWNSYQDKLQISNSESFTDINPMVGFRFIGVEEKDLRDSKY